MSEYEDILYETDGRLAYITLNRPEKLARRPFRDFRGAYDSAPKDRPLAGTEAND